MAAITNTEYSIVPTGRALVGIEGQSADIRTLVFKSAGSTVVKGRWIRGDGRACPTPTTGATKFVFTVTTTTKTLQELIAAATLLIPVNASGMRLNITGDDLYWNNCGLLNQGSATHDAAMTDWAPDPDYDHTIPGGSHVCFGRMVP